MKTTSTLFSLFFVSSLCFSNKGLAQSVTGIITDYKGFWKSSAAAINAVKPDNSHNLLAFSFNGKQYSTGVNDALLYARNESFTATDFWSLPVAGLSGPATGNTKIGVGELYDGVCNGASNPAPENNLSKYLTDGTKGLDLGTCVANLPAGILSFNVFNLKAGSIGDGVPDILITQVADPTGNSYDRYEFVDEWGVRIGNYKDIVFNSVAPVGNWVVDFYEASKNPMTLAGGYTQTERPIRLWAADLSDFGITAANLSRIKNFRINLSGNSDVAFVGYNQQSVAMAIILPFQSIELKGKSGEGKTLLSWDVKTDEQSGELFLEKSSKGTSFHTISNLPLSQATLSGSYTDYSADAGGYYRLKIVSSNGEVAYSNIVAINTAAEQKVKVFPNPTRGLFTVSNLPADATKAQLHNAAGVLLQQKFVSNGDTQLQFDVTGYQAGAYYVTLRGSKSAGTQQLIIK